MQVLQSGSQPAPAVAEPHVVAVETSGHEADHTKLDPRAIKQKKAQRLLLLADVDPVPVLHGLSAYCDSSPIAPVVFFRHQPWRADRLLAAAAFRQPLRAAPVPRLVLLLLRCKVCVCCCHCVC